MHSRSTSWPRKYNEGFSRHENNDGRLRCGLQSASVCATASKGRGIRRLAAASSGRIDFSRDIRQILSDKCFVCHGPDAPNNKSKLRFDTEAHALADLGNGRRAIVRGHPEQSDLVRRVTAENASIRMPPVYSGRQLTKQEIEQLTGWIAQGRCGNSIGHSLPRGHQRRK
jgi:hypothetical protein